MAPGPNNLLSVNNATHYGFWVSCLAGAGRLIAFAAMIALAAAGLTAVLETSELVFLGIKFLGAAYLFYLAFKLWTAKIQNQALIFCEIFFLLASFQSEAPKTA